MINELHRQVAKYLRSDGSFGRYDAHEMLNARMQISAYLSLPSDPQMALETLAEIETGNIHEWTGPDALDFCLKCGQSRIRNAGAAELRARIRPYLNPGWQGVLNPGQRMHDRVRELLRNIFVYLGCRKEK